MQTLGERLAHILKLRGWSGRELARRAKLASEGSVGHVIQGVTKGMRMESLQAIADAAHVRLEWLSAGTGPVDDALQDGSPASRGAQAFVLLADDPKDAEQWLQGVARRVSINVPGVSAEEHMRALRLSYLQDRASNTNTSAPYEVSPDPPIQERKRGRT